MQGRYGLQEDYKMTVSIDFEGLLRDLVEAYDADAADPTIPSSGKLEAALKEARKYLEISDNHQPWRRQRLP